MKINEGNIDRVIRIVLAEIFLLGGFFWTGGVISTGLIIVGTIFLITAVSGFCALYKVLNMSTLRPVDKPISKKASMLSALIAIIIFALGSYLSVFFSTKIYIEDFNRMNQHYKQTLFFTGQEKRAEAVDNYNKLINEYQIFNNKYQAYHPYSLSQDKSLNSDLNKVDGIIKGLSATVNSGDLKSAHLELEQVRPIFQEIFKRNNFSMLAITLVDFHDSMEKIIATADAKDSAATIAVYYEVNEKLKAVQILANDDEIMLIRTKLDEVKSLADSGKSDQLSSKAAELKSAFVKVYLKRG